MRGIKNIMQNWRSAKKEFTSDIASVREGLTVTFVLAATAMLAHYSGLNDAGGFLQDTAKLNAETTLDIGRNAVKNFARRPQAKFTL